MPRTPFVDHHTACHCTSVGGCSQPQTTESMRSPVSLARIRHATVFLRAGMTLLRGGIPAGLRARCSGLIQALDVMVAIRRVEIEVDRRGLGRDRGRPLQQNCRPGAGMVLELGELAPLLTTRGPIPQVRRRPRSRWSADPDAIQRDEDHGCGRAGEAGTWRRVGCSWRTVSPSSTGTALRSRARTRARERYPTRTPSDDTVVLRYPRIPQIWFGCMVGWTPAT
jgi:hypothetical protein